MGVLAESFEHFSVPTFRWRRDGQVVRFSGNFYSSAYKPKMRIIPEKQKIPMPFLAQRCRLGHKKSPQENSCGGYYTVAILLSILVFTEGSSFFVSTSAIIIITHYLGHVSVRLVPL